MTLDEIMENEKFNETEKALVRQRDLQQAERIKIVSEIKIAKSNDRHSRRMGGLTYVLACLGVLEIFLPEVTSAQSAGAQALAMLAGAGLIFAIVYIMGKTRK